LLSAAPIVEYGRQQQRFRLSGEIPSPIDLPVGCRLATRCSLAEDECRREDPPLLSIERHHLVACPPQARTLAAARGCLASAPSV
jgi:peptide/nickel transport system ATP-binding protein/oligopeptide transport system ATP-binding protein